jgi:hypothetical protein
MERNGTALRFFNKFLYFHVSNSIETVLQKLRVIQLLKTSSNLKEHPRFTTEHRHCLPITFLCAILSTPRMLLAQPLAHAFLWACYKYLLRSTNIRKASRCGRLHPFDTYRSFITHASRCSCFSVYVWTQFFSFRARNQKKNSHAPRFEAVDP